MAQLGLARLLWEQEVVGSNPTAPTIDYLTMKIIERQKAVKLRKKGWTYAEIGKCLGVSRGALSLWLRNIPYVPSEATRRRRQLASLKASQVLHKRKLKRITQIKKIAKQEIEHIKNNELKLLGIIAYWAEGSKTEDHFVRFTNSDPIMIKFILRWLREICCVPEEKLRVHLRVHPDVDKKVTENYWSKVTGIPLTQFNKTTAKVSGSNGRRYSKLGYGIARITVCSTDLYYKIIGWIEGLQEGAK